MTDTTPEHWSTWDDIAVEIHTVRDTIERLGDYNTLVFFTDQLLALEAEGEVELDDDDINMLEDFHDDATTIDKRIQKHLGKDYITDYIETIDTEENDD